MVGHGDGNRVRQLSQPAAAHFIIGVDNRLAEVVSGVEHPLRRFVVFHIAVIVEVVAAQVGKDRGGELERRGAVLDQAVRRDFHRGKGRALPFQGGKDVLHVNRRSGGVLRGNHFAQQAVADGAHHRRGFTQQLRPLGQQLGGGGFTVGTGNADKLQPFGRLMVEAPRQGGEALV